MQMLVLAAICGSIALVSDDDGNWSMYNRDVKGWRFNQAEKTLQSNNVGKLEEQWRFPAKGATFEIGVVHATPAVVGGKVYFGTASDPAFYALNEGGSLKWVYRNPKLGAAKKEAILR